ncbi:precorrin-6A/cobalt-precorrin-6A reductase [Marinomonas spartinae]|uniref:precorrin-6A/cobalt-precorrin-6A reductase n=1 Tax=Marinomonas spartinae TaxID=1792290 RepID=UPI001F21D0BB|nr:precorrin-6A/cobalt-precorrin-6A reductase [Marinomonas spartinae]
MMALDAKERTKKLLLLGGTADARRLADALHQAGISVIYSLAGLVRVPKVDCELVVGGFTQFGGLANYLTEQNVAAILDVTHPYAQTMSSKAVEAAREVGIPCWRFHRPAWQAVAGDQWRYYDDDEALILQLAHFKRPLLSAGQVSEDSLLRILQLPSIEYVVWRTAVTPAFDLPRAVHWVKAIGPFHLEEEQQLLQAQQVDVIVSKNSGGSATYAKLEAARALSIPVLLHTRPRLPEADQEFSDTDKCLQACLAAWGNIIPTFKTQQKDNQQ